MIKVNEIFFSIQGESSFAGYPCVFARLTGCNLRCSYCDTAYAYEEGADFELSRLVSRIEEFRWPLVEITGGEPLVQEETPELVRILLEKKFQVLVETNGSLDISGIAGCVRILDIKCPSSGESERNDLQNLKRLTDKDELKFVIGDRADFDFARSIATGAGLPPGIPIHFSPVFGKLPPETLAGWILEHKLPVRLQLQLHKIVWGNERGR